MKKRFSLQAFYRLLFQFIAVLVIGGCASIMAFVQARDLVGRNTEEQSFSALKNSSLLFRRNLSELDGIASFVGEGNWIRFFYTLDKDFPVESIWKMNEIQKQLAVYPGINNLISDIYIYYYNSGVFISSGLAATRADSYYGDNFHYDRFDLQSWQAYVRDENMNRKLVHERIYLNTVESQSSYVYYTLLPVAGLSSPKATLGFILSREEVEKFFIQFSPRPMGIYERYSGESLFRNELMESYGFALGGQSGRERKNGIEMLENGDRLLTVTDDSFMYVLVLTRGEMKNSVSRVSRIYLLIMGFAFVPGVGLAFLLSYKRSRPIKHIISQLSDSLELQPGDVNVNLEFIEENLDALVSKKHFLEASLENQLPLLKAGFHEKLLRGDYSGEAEIVETAEKIGLDLSGRYHFVALVDVEYAQREEDDYFSKINVIGMMIEFFSSRSSQSNSLFHFMGKNLTVLVCHSDSPMNEYIARNSADLENLVSDINREIKGTVRVSGGMFYDSLTDIARSYGEAKQIRDIWFPTENVSLAWYSGVNHLDMGCPFTGKETEKLCGLVVMEKRGEYEAMVRERITAPLAGGCLSLNDRERLMEEVQSVIMKLIARTSTGDDSNRERLKSMARNIHFAASRDEWEKKILETLNFCSLLILNGKRSRNYDLRDRVIHDLEENYADPDICLPLYATKYSLTEQYLSQFIKEQTGQGFAAYLEKIRMDKIASELITSRDAIAVISGRNGYRNKNTFYKAFKRRYGLSPREYRIRNVTSSVR